MHNYMMSTILLERLVTEKKQQQTNIKISKDWTLVDDALPPDSNTGKVIWGLIRVNAGQKKGPWPRCHH